MTDKGQSKSILGYVSAYLNQPPRTYAEAERDRRTGNAQIETGESKVSSDSQPDPSAPRPAAHEK